MSSFTTAEKGKNKAEDHVCDIPLGSDNLTLQDDPDPDTSIITDLTSEVLDDPLNHQPDDERQEVSDNFGEHANDPFNENM